MHANALITFDLREIRKAGLMHPEQHLVFKTNRAGLNDDVNQSGASVHLAVIVAKKQSKENVFDAILAGYVNGRKAAVEENDKEYYFAGALPDPIKSDGEFASFEIPIPPEAEFLTLVATGAQWMFLDDGTNQGINWVRPDFDDSTWSSGPSVLGYGDPVDTIVGFGGDGGNKFITTYFRHTFDIADPALFADLRGELRRDDGAAVYLNGTEIFRDNLVAGADYLQTAAGNTGSETAYRPFVIDLGLLVEGTNTLAVEVRSHSHCVTLTGRPNSFRK